MAPDLVIQHHEEELTAANGAIYGGMRTSRGRNATDGHNFGGLTPFVKPTVADGVAGKNSPPSGGYNRHYYYYYYFLWFDAFCQTNGGRRCCEEDKMTSQILW